MTTFSEPERIKVFWSWQTDSDSTVNRNFVEDCLKRAAKKINKTSVSIIEIDRDTKNVGGSPEIVRTILKKIRGCDVFVWDATLVYERPRPAPNPNVVFEHGYALAVLGYNRIIGVMNCPDEKVSDKLPFDFGHRRWPIRYSLKRRSRIDSLIRFFSSKNTFTERRKTARTKLVDELVDAIEASIKEPKDSYLHNDVDMTAAQNLWSRIDSRWMQNWIEERLTHPQYELRTYIDTLNEYIFDAERQENRFINERLFLCHKALVEAIVNYLHTTGIEMIPHNGDGVYIISTKASTKWQDDYSKKYDRQTNVVIQGCKAIKTAWNNYIDILREFYPEIVSV